ncbi:hypothetical protein C4585_00815 [Candidatus Parcubacteria bacterium]|nr:MAG: hypothetical protein C4585_00815 [Candidatus Parcubacteria bacterium]
MQNFSIPIAIVVAGALIAGALYFSNSGGGGGNTSGSGTQTAPIEIRAVRSDEHVRGNSDAKVAVVEFSDTECPFCKRFDETMQQVTQNYSGDQVAWVYRHFPLEQLHPKAPKEAEAMECAAEQGGNDVFWKYYDMIYSRTDANNSLDIGVYNTPKPTPKDASGNPYYTEKAPRSSTDAGKLSDFAVELGLNKTQFEECLSSGRYTEKVEEDAAEASSSGGTGTPYIVFVSKDKISKQTKEVLDSMIPSVGPDTFVLSEDGYRISMSGALPYEMVQQVIDSLLQ